MRPISDGFIVLFSVMLLGFFAQNRTVVYAVLIVLALKFLRFDVGIIFLESQGLRWSIIFLTAAVLAPFASDTISLKEMSAQFREPFGIMAILMGAFATYLARQGVVLMDQSPNVVPAIISGTIIGITFFRGVPTGPLVSSGILAIIFAIYNFFK